MENKCNLCPRACNINRKISAGFCGATGLKIAKIKRHFGEEPPLTGTTGSGTIFFSHCSLKCCYCQNYEISHNGFGKKVDINFLVDAFKMIEDSSAVNINLISPTHYTTQIIEALNIYKPHIPVVWNSSGYETVETIKLLKNYVDIYLPDFKYADNNIAMEYSKAQNYFNTALNAIKQMRENQPQDVFSGNIMQKGLIIRHMVLPNQMQNSIDVLNCIKQNFGTDVFLSVLSQYMPCYKSCEYQKLNRTLNPLEYKLILHHINNLNFKNVFVQELSSNTNELVPEFLNGKLIEL